MTSEEIEEQILWLGVEDASGLWEALWLLNARMPSVPQDKRVIHARTALKSLVRGGYLEICRCVEPHGELSPLGSNEVEDLIEQTDFAEPAPTQEICIRLAATEKGRKRVLKGA